MPHKRVPEKINEILDKLPGIENLEPDELDLLGEYLYAVRDDMEETPRVRLGAFQLLTFVEARRIALQQH